MSVSGSRTENRVLFRTRGWASCIKCASSSGGGLQPSNFQIVYFPQAAGNGLPDVKPASGSIAVVRPAADGVHLFHIME